MTLSRVIDKMVVDEGRALQPCRYRLFTHMYCIPCTGLKDFGMYGCTRELEDSVTTTQHRTNSPGALKIKAGVKTREHDSRREHRMSREPPGY